MNLDSLKYPIGVFEAPKDYSHQQRQACIQTIAELPSKLLTVHDQASETDWNSPYRPGGWTLRQLMHHIADSHMNAFIRFKWTMSENNPMIKTYDEQAWSELSDYTADPLISLRLIEALHRRWVYFLENLQQNEWSKTFVHPEYDKTFDLNTLLSLYDWHSKHHLAHFRLVIPL